MLLSQHQSGPRKLAAIAIALALIFSLIAQPALAIAPQQAAENDPEATSYQISCQAGVCTKGAVNVGASCGDGQICQANGACRCSGASCGTCRTCNTTSGQCESVTCGTDPDCPGGCACSGGICGTTPTCRAFQQTCTNNFQCCSVGCFQRCFCSEAGEPCYNSSDCCSNPSAQTCKGFVCVPN